MSTSYTTLKGFDSISDVDIESTIQQNIIGFFDWGFINKGAFTNVHLSTTDIRSNDKSILIPVNEAGKSSGQVWTTFRKNLVWESGLYTVSQPIQISGVYVNGSFKTPTTSGYQHYVDYVNGRVVFTTPIPTNSTVKMEHSYKNLLVTNLSVVPLIKEAQAHSFDISSEGYSVRSGDWTQYTNQIVQLPLIAVEMTPNASFSAIEIGQVNQYLDIDVILHTLAESKSDAMKYAMGSASQQEKTIFMYNLTMMNASGALPLDYRGAKVVNPLTYEQLVRESRDGGYRYNKLYFFNSRLVGPNPVGNLYHAATRYTVRTTLIC